MAFDLWVCHKGNNEKQSNLTKTIGNGIVRYKWKKLYFNNNKYEVAIKLGGGETGSRYVVSYQVCWYVQMKG